MRLKNRKRNAIDEAIEVYTPYLSTVLYNMLNARLIADGYAYDKVYEPNDKYADVFHTLRISSQEAGNGLWKYQGFSELWE